MPRRILFLMAVLLVAAGALLVVPLIVKARFKAHLASSQNNLREIALFAAYNASTNPKLDRGRLPREIPPATLVLPETPPENRLSWFVYVLPGLDQKKHPTEQLIAQINRDKPWSDDANQQAGRTRLPTLLCPENTPEVAPNDPAITCYVGVAGLGTDAATLAIPADGPTPPRVGAFRYDGPTPFDKITDGLSQTLLLGETADAPGPWLRGGVSTVRGFDDAAEAKPLIGFGGQFGGFFPTGANFALCDGSVRMFSPRTSRDVLLKMATIAGGEKEMNAGE